MERGLGRAVLFLQSNDDAPFRWLIADACRKDFRYSGHERHRAAYIHDLIRASRAPDFYRAVVLDALTNRRENDYAEQLLNLAALFARDGDKAMRKAFHSAFSRNVIVNQRIDGEDGLLELDGLNGYRYAVELLMAHPLPGDERWQETSLWGDAVRKFGEEAVMALGADDPALTEYLTTIQAEVREQRQERDKITPPLPLYEKLKQMIELPRGQEIIPTRSWAEEMSPVDVERLLQDMARETDPVRLRRYLRLLRHTNDIPDLSFVISLTRREDDPMLVREAINSLEEITHPDVRARGEELMSDLSKTGDVANGLELLVTNPQEGDYATIASALHTATEQGQDALHDMNFAVRDYFEVNPAPEGVPLMLFLYENLACGMCRGSAVARLKAAGAIPNWLREEARYDADTGTREEVLALPPPA